MANNFYYYEPFDFDDVFAARIGAPILATTSTYQFVNAQGYGVAVGGSGFSYSGDEPAGGSFTYIAVYADGTMSDLVAELMIDHPYGDLAQLFSASYWADTISAMQTSYSPGDAIFDTVAINGGLGADSIMGGNGNDLLDGGAGADSLNGGFGDDTLRGGEGLDNVTGNNGDDTLLVASGDLASGDRFFGDEGSDTLKILGAIDLRVSATFSLENLDVNGFTAQINASQLRSSGFSYITSSTGTGALVVYGTANLLSMAIDPGIAITLNGGAGTVNDSLVGSVLNDTLNGLAGNDVLSAQDGDDVLSGGAGLDGMYGGDGADRFEFAASDVVAGERIYGGLDTDSIRLLGSNTFVGAIISSVETVNLNGKAATFAAAQLSAGAISSVTSSLAGGTLTVIGSANLSAVSVASGIAITLNGATGVVNDTITGSAMPNTINGLDGNDTLRGGGGNDTINGGNGNDVVTGGAGRDVMNGNAGADRFDFDATTETGKGTLRDAIYGFSKTELDKIDLSTIDASTTVAGNQAFAFVGAGAFTGVAGQLRFAGGIVYGDVNGDRVSDFEIAVVGLASLAATDFVL